MSELRKCPKCGRESEVREANYLDPIYHALPKHRFFLGTCEGCPESPDGVGNIFWHLEPISVENSAQVPEPDRR